MSDCFPMALPINYIVKLGIFANRMVALQLCLVTVMFDSMVFPVVMYGGERWTIKEAERQRIDVFELW